MVWQNIVLAMLLVKIQEDTPGLMTVPACQLFWLRLPKRMMFTPMGLVMIIVSVSSRSVKLKKKNTTGAMKDRQVLSIGASSIQLAMV